MAYTDKISDLDEKIRKLELEKEKLEQKRNSEIASFIIKVGLSDIEDDVIVGALLYIKDFLKSDEKLKEEWKESGRKFLRRKQLNKPVSEK